MRDVLGSVATQVEDAQLVSRCLDGDTAAYEELVRKYQDAVFATALYYTGRHGAAEDIAQDTFLIAYRSLPRLKNHEVFAGLAKGHRHADSHELAPAACQGNASGDADSRKADNIDRGRAAGAGRGSRAQGES